MEQLKLPCVVPVGYVDLGIEEVLITKYLADSIPYRSLFMECPEERELDRLLDAMAGLLVQLHLAGVYWGDCSLSNTLFRRDAGSLQAYLVDAETIEIHETLSDGMRIHDQEIMEENLLGGLYDLIASGSLHASFPVQDTGDSACARYQSLWTQISEEWQIDRTERYRIKERIALLNEMGFSIEELVIQPGQNQQTWRVKVHVADRNYHRQKMSTLTGIEAEEQQARQLLHEIMEFKVAMNQDGEDIELSEVAACWYNSYYRPVLIELETKIPASMTEPECYCRFLEHKWYLSEEEGCDVGRETALEDFRRVLASIQAP